MLVRSLVIMASETHRVDRPRPRRAYKRHHSHAGDREQSKASRCPERDGGRPSLSSSLAQVFGHDGRPASLEGSPRPSL